VSGPYRGQRGSCAQNSGEYESAETRELCTPCSARSVGKKSNVSEFSVQKLLFTEGHRNCMHEKGGDSTTTVTSLETECRVISVETI